MEKRLIALLSQLHLSMVYGAAFVWWIDCFTTRSMGQLLNSASSKRGMAKLLSGLLGTALLIWAQAETGQVAGTITDPSGAVVSSAAVKIANVATGAERNSSSNGAGLFTVTNLEPGDYTITVSSAGFSTLSQRFTLTVGQKIGLDLKLQVGNTTTTVEVTET